MVIENIVKAELKKTSLFRDESKLSIDYIPKELPHRDAKMRKLTRIFKELVENPGGGSKKVLLTGSSGISWISPKKYVEKVGEAAYKKNPIGCGPYKFVEFILA